MEAIVSGMGVWGPGFCNIDEYRQVLSDAPMVSGETVPPKPDLIPARERRRSPLMVKLAIEVAAQACEMADVEPADALCVFSSGIGDAGLTDYMCRVLAGPDKLLSPTKFHNSVHNAAVGYWSISTGCEQAASFVSSMQTSFTMSLMESMVQASTENKPVLLVLSDLPIPRPMKEMHPIDDLFGAALLIVPQQSEGSSAQQHAGKAISMALVKDKCDWPEITVPGLYSLYSSSPAARSLCMLEALCNGHQQQLNLPLSDGLSAAISIGDHNLQ